MFAYVTPSHDEVDRALPGDDIVPNAEVVMDRAFTLSAPPEVVWPWFMQLGKHRAGWYLPRSIEHVVPAKQRGLWRIEPTLQNLQIGTIIDDWGGKDATFEVAILELPYALVHKSVRGTTHLSWAIILEPQGEHTRVQLRLRLAPVKYKALARTFGGFFDLLTVAGLAKGLEQRLKLTKD